MSLKLRLLRAQETGLCLIRKWWRPLSCAGLVASLWVNLVIIPWMKREAVELEKAALFVTAVVAAFAVREVGKKWGTADRAE